MKSRTIGLHIKASIRLVIAKLNRRQSEDRRWREFVAIAKQTRKFPGDPKTPTIALTVSSGILWVYGREQLIASAHETFMLWGLVYDGVMDVSNVAFSSSAVLLLAELHAREAEHHG